MKLLTYSIHPWVVTLQDLARIPAVIPDYDVTVLEINTIRTQNNMQKMFLTLYQLNLNIML
jgi:hypothetical protein